VAPKTGEPKLLPLITVGDSQGLSYYSDMTAARLLGLSQAELRQARNNLLGAGLIAYRDPLLLFVF
jgi:hypothetical protein